MSTFSSDKFEKLLAPYLSETEKGRLLKSLLQFKGNSSKENINYSNFYLNSSKSVFLQGDLLNEIRHAKWNDKTYQYEKEYPIGLVLSNTCDLHKDNEREIQKDALFAPSVELSIYLSFLRSKGVSITKIQTIENNIKQQNYSNVFYLPGTNQNKKEYVVLFDKIYWFPIDELNTYLDNIAENRIASLNYFGHYLLLIKLSYHLCRLPEESDRAENETKESIKLFQRIKKFFTKKE